MTAGRQPPPRPLSCPRGVAPSPGAVMGLRFVSDGPPSVADLIERLGGIDPDRIRLLPAPGTATEADLEVARKPICELIDGSLVEMHNWTSSSYITGNVAAPLGNHIHEHDLGVLAGPGGGVRLGPGLIRSASVTYIPWENLPRGRFPREPFWAVVPALIVQVIDPSNTAAEIGRKLREFFAVGCQLAWVIDWQARTARVYPAADRFAVLDETGVLDGGVVLPGFRLPLADVFADTM